MAEIKISDLTSATEPSGGEVFAVVQNNTTHKTTIDSLKPALVDNLSTGAPTWTTDGILTAGHDIIAGGNDTGRIALTLNDGYGDANITFNHTGGIPDRSGSSARIVSSVDSTQEVLDFQLKGNVAAGSPVTLTSVLKLYDDSVQLLKPTTLSANGTTTNSLVNKGYIDDALSGKSDVGHTHSQYSLTTHLHDSRYSQIGHTHSISNITNLQTTLDGKIGETEINSAHFTFTNNTLSLKTIQEGQIATDAVTSTKIADANVTTAKIADANVTFAKLTDVIDDDTMATASATKLATSESIKAYVDNNGITQTGGSAPYFGVRAWAYYNGTTNNLIQGGNIASVTRNGPGDYTFRFIENMPDVNYAISIAYSNEVNVQHGVAFVAGHAVDYFRIQHYNPANSANRMDKTYVAVSVIR